MHPKVVSDRLGHSTISITLDIYSHVTPTLDADAAATVASQIFGGGSRSRRLQSDSPSDRC